MRWESARSYCFERTEQHIVYVDESDHMAGLVHIHDHPIQVGSCAVRKADVGHVAHEVRAGHEGVVLVRRGVHLAVAHQNR